MRLGERRAGVGLGGQHELAFGLRQLRIERLPEAVRQRRPRAGVHGIGQHGLVKAAQVHASAGQPLPRGRIGVVGERRELGQRMILEGAIRAALGPLYQRLDQDAEFGRVAGPGRG